MLIDSSGYTITGLPPGSYLATIEWYDQIKILDWISPTTGPFFLDTLDGFYSSNKTPLSCVVTDKQAFQSFDFDLKKGPVPTFSPLEKSKNNSSQFQNSTWQLDLSVTDPVERRDFPDVAIAHTRVCRGISGRIKNLSDRQQPAGKLFFVVRFSEYDTRLLPVEVGPVASGTELPIKKTLISFSALTVDSLEPLPVQGVTQIVRPERLPDVLQGRFDPPKGP